MKMGMKRKMGRKMGTVTIVLREVKEKNGGYSHLPIYSHLPFTRSQSESNKSSARAFSGIFLNGSPASVRLLRTNFRLCANPACRRAKNRFSFAFVAKFFREISRMVSTAESTFGAGLNAPRGTVNSYFGTPYAFTESERMLSFFERAMRSATSFCTRSVIALG